jgi:hypothetical protein
MLISESSGRTIRFRPALPVKLFTVNDLQVLLRLRGTFGVSLKNFCLGAEVICSEATVARRWKALVFNHENHALASVAAFLHGLGEADYVLC